MNIDIYIYIYKEHDICVKDSYIQVCVQYQHTYMYTQMNTPLTY